MSTSRVLRVSFEIRIPPGVRTNVHTPRVETAVARFTGAMENLVGREFPSADRIVVEHSWNYELFSGRDEIELQTTDKNTVTEPPA